MSHAITLKAFALIKLPTVNACLSRVSCYRCHCYRRRQKGLNGDDESRSKFC